MRMGAQGLRNQRVGYRDMTRMRETFWQGESKGLKELGLG